MSRRIDTMDLAPRALGRVSSSSRPLRRLFVGAVAALLCAAPRPGLAGKSSRPKPAKVCAYRTPVHLHAVQPGEHLGLIAGQYGVYRRDLVELNPELSDPNHIRPGQLIKVCPEIPPREEERFVHRVEAGESLAKVAKRYDIEVADLIEMQGDSLRDPNNIWVGQELTIVRDGPILSGFEPEAPKRGGLSSPVRLREGAGYVLRRPHLAYGTAATIKNIQRVLGRYQKRAGGGPKVRVGDISKRGGGPLSGHLSHREGVDVDIGLIHRGAAANSTRFVDATNANLDVGRTWILVHEFLRTGQVRYIFLDYRIQKRLYEHALKKGVSKQQLDAWFQYPRGRGKGHGIVRHWRNHNDHIHVRFRR